MNLLCNQKSSTPLSRSLHRLINRLIIHAAKYIKPIFQKLGLKYELFASAPVDHPAWEELKISFVMCRKHGISKGTLIGPMANEMNRQGFTIDGINSLLDEVYSISFDVEAALKGKDAIIKKMYGQ